MTQWKWPGSRAVGSGSEQAEPDAPDAAGPGRFSRRQRWLAGGAAALVALSIMLLLGVSPWIRSRAVKEAARRGVELQVGGVSPGWFRATLRDVTARPTGVPSIRVRLAAASVKLGPSLRPADLLVEDGLIEIDGPLDEVVAQMDAWRERWRRGAGTEDATDVASGGPRYRASGVDLVWRNAFIEGDEQRWDGLQFERSGELQQVGLDHLELRHPRGGLELAGLRALWRRDSSGLHLVEADVAEARVKASWAPAATEPTESASLDTLGDAEAARRAAQARTRTPVPAQEAEESGLASRLPPLDPERGDRWQRRMQRWIHALGNRLPEKSKVAALFLELERGEQRLHLGPSTFEVRRGEAALELALTPQGKTQGTPLAIQATLPREKGPVRLEVEGGPVSLATLGVREGDFGLVGVEQAEVGGHVKAELSQDASRLALAADAQLTRVALQNDRLAPRPVSVEKTRLAGNVQIDVGGESYALEEGELQVGQATFRLQGNLERGPEHVAVRLRGGTPLIACQTLLDSAPRGLLDRVEQIRMQGTLALDVGVEFDSRKPADMKVGWDLKNACRITDVPPSLAPARFSMPWAHEITGPNNTPLVLETGPGTLAWTPIEHMSPHLEAAVLVSEDGRFFRHDGFDSRAIEASIQANVRAGRFVRGASTISMQLAKNLYLSREKQLSRKLQEAVLTLLLEQRLSKRELLEIYFNIVELGPGVYGIRHAAEHYFNTTPDQLTLAQAFFLVSILPSPTRQFFNAEGRLNEGRAAYVRQLLKIARDRGRITDSELEVGLAEELRFGVSHHHENGGFDHDLHEPFSEGALGEPGAATRTAPPPVRPPPPPPRSRASATDGSAPLPNLSPP